MELPKHTCISCAYLCEKADGYYGISPRSQILENKNQIWIGADYIYLVCYKNKLPNFYCTGKTTEYIRNTIINPTKCKHWVQFINGVSPVATEQRDSAKKSLTWIIWTFVIIVITLIVAFATFINTL